MNRKQKILRLIFFIEFACCGYFYLYGSGGLKKVRNLGEEIKKIEFEVAQAQKEVENLKSELESWGTDEFNVERYARERLAMGYGDEEVFLF